MKLIWTAAKVLQSQHKTFTGDSNPELFQNKIVVFPLFCHYNTWHKCLVVIKLSFIKLDHFRILWCVANFHSHVNKSLRVSWVSSLRKPIRSHCRAVPYTSLTDHFNFLIFDTIGATNVSNFGTQLSCFQTASPGMCKPRPGGHVCGPLSFLNRPVKLEEILLIVSQ